MKDAPPFSHMHSAKRTRHTVRPGWKKHSTRPEGMQDRRHHAEGFLVLPYANRSLDAPYPQLRRGGRHRRARQLAANRVIESFPTTAGKPFPNWDDRRGCTAMCLG